MEQGYQAGDAQADAAEHLVQHIGYIADLPHFNRRKISAAGLLLLPLLQCLPFLLLFQFPLPGTLLPDRHTVLRLLTLSLLTLRLLLAVKGCI